MTTEKLEKHIQISKGKKHSISEASSAYAKRYLQIDDLRNDKNIKFTEDKTGVEVVERDLIIAWDGANAGTIGFGKKGYIGSTLARLRIKEPRIFHSVFLGKFLQSKFDYLRQTATGATIPHINKSALEGIKVPVFSLPDQIRIATLLSRAEALIEKRRESLRLLDELVKGVFLEMFGDPRKNEKKWKKVRLGDLGEWKSGGTPARKNSDFFTGEILWLTSGELNQMYVSDSIEKITIGAIENSNAKLIEEGSLLLGMYDTAALKSSITKVEVACNQAIAYSLLDDSQCVVEYVYFLIQLGREYFKRLQRGVRQQNMNLSMIKSIPVILPPLPLQTQFAAIVQQVETLKAKCQASLAELENLYGSLSGRAFRGELDLSGMEVEEEFLEYGADDIPDECEPETTVNRVQQWQKVMEQIKVDFQFPTGILEVMDKFGASLRVFQERMKELPPMKSLVDPRTVQQLQNTIEKLEQRLREGITFEQFMETEGFEEYEAAKREIFELLKKEKPFLKQEFDTDRKQIIFRLHETD